MTGPKKGQPDRNSPEFKKRVDERAYFIGQRKAEDVDNSKDANFVQAENEELLKGEIITGVGGKIDEGIIATNSAADRSETAAEQASERASHAT